MLIEPTAFLLYKGVDERVIDSKIQKYMSYIIGGIYLVLLLWLLLYAFDVNYWEARRGRIVIIGLDGPAASALYYAKEIIYNSLFFVPWGMFVCMFQPRGRFITKILLILAASVGIEAIQYFYEMGVRNINDMVGNVVGGMIGILIYYLIKWIVRKKHIVVLNSIGIIIDIMAVLMLRQPRY